jgi:hypothetical protein
MVRRRLSLTLVIVALLSGSLCVRDRSACAQGSSSLDHISLDYWGGPLLQHVKVVNLFWGAYWLSALDEATYFNSFFADLFSDGRYLANLEQYSAGGYRIGSGQFLTSFIHGQVLPDRVTDDQIQAGIGILIASGLVPAPDADTLYFVFTPPNTTVETRWGNSGADFSAYHYYSRDPNHARFSYAVIPFATTKDEQGREQTDREFLTFACSHELAEAVTDPQPISSATLGWYDIYNGEVGDIVNFLFYGKRIDETGLKDVLFGPTGTQYTVQKVWSNWDRSPVAFATSSFFPRDGDPFSPEYLTPERKGRNLLQNASFEGGGTGWFVYSARGRLNAWATSSQVREGGLAVFLNTAPDDDDLFVWQSVAVKSHTRYLLSGWVLTQNVENSQAGGTNGASLSIWGGYNHTQSLTGTHDWTYLALVFDSGDLSALYVGPRLGLWSSRASGNAWFDDLCLIELP